VSVCLFAQLLLSIYTFFLEFNRTEIYLVGNYMAAATVWNDLPTDIRFADSFVNFHSLLLTHFYRLAFN